MTGDGGRQLASAFSTRCVRSLASAHHPWPLERLAPLIDLVDHDAPLAEAFDAAYRGLCSAYRCEYVYTNALVSQAPNGSEANTNVISGLRLFVSIADIVTVGDSAVGFEVKTDLDDFSRLDMQMLSYSSCLEYVNVLTSPAKAQRAARAAPAHVGIMSLDERDGLAVVRPAESNLGRIEVASLVRVLRQAELRAICERQCGYVPNVPPAHLYRRLHGLFTGLPVETAYREFVRELRGRDAVKRRAAQTAGLPDSLRAVAAGLSLSPTAWRRLGAVLQRPAVSFRRGAHG